MGIKIVMRINNERKKSVCDLPSPYWKVVDANKFPTNISIQSGLFDTFSLFLAVNFFLLWNCFNKSNTSPRKSCENLLKFLIAYTLIINILFTLVIQLQSIHHSITSTIAFYPAYSIPSIKHTVYPAYSIRQHNATQPLFIESYIRRIPEWYFLSNVLLCWGIQIFFSSMLLY